jgi:hypothetical protein
MRHFEASFPPNFSVFGNFDTDCLFPNNLTFPDDPGVKEGRWRSPPEKKRNPAPRSEESAHRPRRDQSVRQVLERGYGYATFNYNEIDPDVLNATDFMDKHLKAPK